LVPKPTSVGVIISPEIAKGFAKEGLPTREAVQKYLWENTTQTYKEWSNTSWFRLMEAMSLRGLYGRDWWPAEYFKLRPEAVVKIYPRPENIFLIVSTKGQTVVSLQYPITASVDKWR
jgi:hypothetical protein